MLYSEPILTCDKQVLLNAFIPLSENGKKILEVLLISPKNGNVEGRGFFNDPDFLIEACTPFIGRYNFSLSAFAYSPEKVAGRIAINKIDRGLVEPKIQELGEAHSLSLHLMFKPELMREMTAFSENNGGADYSLQIVYQIQHIFERLQLHTYVLDYFFTGMVVRFNPVRELQKYRLNKSTWAQVNKKLLEVLEKEMFPGEHKKYALQSSVMGKVWDPLPGMPGMFMGADHECLIVRSSGGLQAAEENFFTDLFSNALEGKQNQQSSQSVYASANTHGLSQHWEEAVDPSLLPNDPQAAKNFAGAKPGFPEIQEQNSSSELNHFLHHRVLTKWRWPLFSNVFNKVYQGIGCGQVLFLQGLSFSGELCFQFLLQSAESFSKEGAGQVLFFTKKRTIGDMALASLSRHYKSNPLISRAAGQFPDIDGLVATYESLFTNAPQLMQSPPREGLEDILRYLEHDYILKQKKNGEGLIPLVIIIDNLEEYAAEDPQETYRNLAQLRNKLVDLNATLWISQVGSTWESISTLYLGLANYALRLDTDGALEGLDGRPGSNSQKLWENQFVVEPNLSKIMQELSLVKLHFRMHGAHREYSSSYIFQNSSCLFRETSSLDVSA